MRYLKYNLILFILGIFLFASMNAQEPNNATISGGSSRHEIVLATWNIGHLSNGEKPYSFIGPKQLKDKVDGFRKILYDSLSADIIGINEYSPVFGKNKHGKDVLSSEVLFNKYDYRYEGNEYWICNSIFSNINVYNIERFFYKSSLPYIVKVKKAALFNYLSADIFLDGEKVKIVYVHLISKEHQIRTQQIKELAEKYKDYERIIIFGDFNTWKLKAFKDEGYILANDGSLITFPSKSIAIDNVLVKGLKISDVRAVKTDLSDHYPLVCKISLN